VSPPAGPGRALAPDRGTGAGHARARAAAALRDLAHAFVGHEVDDGALDELARWAGDRAGAIREGSRRARPDDALLREVVVAGTPGHGERIVHYADCPVSGHDNPLALPAVAWREGDEAVVRATLGRAHEGAPGRAHGGVVAALFDDAFGYLTGLGGEPTYGGRLEVSYHHPTPLGQPLEVRCHFTERGGRRRHASGTLSHRGRVLVRASAVLVTVPAESVGRATYDEAQPGLKAKSGDEA